MTDDDGLDAAITRAAEVAATSLDPFDHRKLHALVAAHHAKDHPPPRFDLALLDGLPASAVSELPDGPGGMTKAPAKK